MSGYGDQFKDLFRRYRDALQRHFEETENYHNQVDTFIAETVTPALEHVCEGIQSEGGQGETRETFSDQNRRDGATIALHYQLGGSQKYVIQVVEGQVYLEYAGTGRGAPVLKREKIQLGPITGLSQDEIGAAVMSAYAARLMDAIDKG